MILTLLDSWLLSLEAERKSPKTIDCYRLGVRHLSAWLTDQGHADDLASISTDLLRRWLIDCSAARSDNTVRNRYNGVRQFLRWCVVEGELAASPMEVVRAPRVRDTVTPMLTDAQLSALLADCDGPTFVQRRDAALVMLFADTGCRLSEAVGMRVGDVDLRDHSAAVTGKGSRPRVLPFGAKTTQALDRYLRQRARQSCADTSWLWLGSTGKGRLTGDGVQQMMQRRGRRLGVRLHPHMLRHGFADAWLKAGGSEVDLMQIAGWRSHQMVGRYAAANRASRARLAHARLSPMDNREP